MTEKREKKSFGGNILNFLKGNTSKFGRTNYIAPKASSVPKPVITSAVPPAAAMKKGGKCRTKK